MFDAETSPFAGEQRKERDRNAAWNAIKADPASAALVAGLSMLAGNDGRRSLGNLAGRAGADALTALGSMEQARRAQERYDEEFALEQEEADRKRRFNELRNQLAVDRYRFEYQKHLDDMRRRAEDRQEDRARRAERAARDAARAEERAAEKAERQARAQEREKARAGRQAGKRGEAPSAPAQPASPQAQPAAPSPAPQVRKKQPMPIVPEEDPDLGNGFFFFRRPRAEAPAAPGLSGEPEALALQGGDGAGIASPASTGGTAGGTAGGTPRAWELLADNDLLKRYGGLRWS